MITTAHIIEKFEQILVHISQEEKQKLTEGKYKELATLHSQEI